VSIADEDEHGESALLGLFEDWVEEFDHVHPTAPDAPLTWDMLIEAMAFAYDRGHAAPRMPNRASLPPGLRFKILKRDGFICVYCGADSRDEALEVDHMTPRCKGGSNRPDNLVTACRRCNAGKSDIALDS
jgi:hypothetical protein